ncbi:DICT sensory domain-containing protein [Coleofasciculus sp. FACHB-1120]|uniref:DICT sensory domain-containing protein n=1 Tax=Coleofasciculus sp. FACHB-1120 TaxID=2692783 RepID=UPI001685CFBD|nr:DICT sensory domain-containing protein [Coleofasciculus sp. FACHB-1120]MBD2742512.1 GAF domain-containing protein [Coleofasciculus sp. FACHB-1120]
MIIPTSVLADLLQVLPQLRPQMYFKSSLIALSHAMEDQVLASLEPHLVIASFQRERFYRQEAHRYRRIAERTEQLYVLAAPETDFTNSSEAYETIAFEPTDGLSQEWHLVVIGQNYATCLVCRERNLTDDGRSLQGTKGKIAGRKGTSAISSSRRTSDSPRTTSRLRISSFEGIDPARRFEGIWTFDRQVSCIVAELLLNRISQYRPELAPKLAQARNIYGIPSTSQFLETSFGTNPEAANRQNFSVQSIQSQAAKEPSVQTPESLTDNPDPFVQCLVTYLQAGQYKLLKAYRSISAQERKERLVNSITAAIRRGSHTGQPLHPDEILSVAVQELGQALFACRCLIYRAGAADTSTTIHHEFLRVTDNGNSRLVSALGHNWPLQENPLFQEVVQKRERVYVADTHLDPRILDPRTVETSTGVSEPASNHSLQPLVSRFSIQSWLMMPVLYQDRLLGIVELHHCGATPYEWQDDELELVEAISIQIGGALIQAEAYVNLEDLNQQLEALDRTRSNLVAITGHELRTPLSTIQVCLESLASEPDMPPEMRQVMLSTALTDAERMRKLVQDFLTLSRLESGRVQWHPEPLALPECIDLALSSIRARNSDGQLPKIVTKVPDSLPLVRADGEWLVEVLAKLLDNACKFTTSKGKISILAECNDSSMLEVTVADTGRGIEPSGLEVVFDRFYQEEGALRRTTGGTGLGLAICRQVVTGWGGEIWAESAGKDQGSQFHFTVPIVARQSAVTSQ